MPAAAILRQVVHGGADARRVGRGAQAQRVFGAMRLHLRAAAHCGAQHGSGEEETHKTNASRHLAHGVGAGSIVRAMTWRQLVAVFRRGRRMCRRSAPPERQADLVEVFKAERRLELKREGRVLKTYRVALGFAPERHKEREGDGRTPEGAYVIDARNPKSAFHLSLRVSYPDDEDKAHAAALGVPPGGDIYIHGQPNGPRKLLVGHPGQGLDHRLRRRHRRRDARDLVAGADRRARGDPSMTLPFDFDCAGETPAGAAGRARCTGRRGACWRWPTSIWRRARPTPSTRASCCRATTRARRWRCSPR